MFFGAKSGFKTNNIAKPNNALFFLFNWMVGLKHIQLKHDFKSFACVYKLIYDVIRFYIDFIGLCMNLYGFV